MIALARETNLTVVAVGIETNRQRELVRELGCSLGQGFLLHRPGAPERLRLREAPGAIIARPMASDRATARQQPPPLSDIDPRARAVRP